MKDFCWRQAIQIVLAVGLVFALVFIASSYAQSEQWSIDYQTETCDMAAGDAIQVAQWRAADYPKAVVLAAMPPLFSDAQHHWVDSIVGFVYDWSLSTGDWIDMAVALKAKCMDEKWERP